MGSNVQQPANENDGAQAVAVDSWDDVYVTGWAYNSGTGYDFTTIKYNPSGSQQWIKSYNGNGNDVDYPESIALDGNNNIYISGWSFGSGTDYDFALVKYSPVGIQLWAQRYNYPANGNDRALSLYCVRRVIGRRGHGLNEMFTVRRISYGEGVERVFPLHSPRVEKVEVERKGSVRRAKLTYLRKRLGKGATLVREKEGRGAGEAEAVSEASQPAQ